jgi:hypothetical protein
VTDPSQAPWGAPPARWNHYTKHRNVLGVATEQENDESARETIRQGIRFEYQERNGISRVGYFDRVRGRLTALERDESRITTHCAASEVYVRRLRSSTYR